MILDKVRLTSLITAMLFAVYPVIALASVGKAMMNIIVAIIKTIAVLERRLRFNAKSRIIRNVDRKEASFCMKLVQYVRYVMGASSIDNRT